MSGRDLNSAIIWAKSSGGAILLWSDLPAADIGEGSVRVVLLSGESFGGHAFDEWKAVADSVEGWVSADWLDV